MAMPDAPQSSLYSMGPPSGRGGTTLLPPAPEVAPLSLGPLAPPAPRSPPPTPNDPPPVLSLPPTPEVLEPALPTLEPAPPWVVPEDLLGMLIPPSSDEHAGM